MERPRRQYLRSWRTGILSSSLLWVGASAWALLIPVWASADGGPSPQEQTAQTEKPAEQVYRNIQVFKGLPNTELMSAMFFMEGSLQVNCGHCHLWADFSKDDKPAKRTARKMILLVRELNATQFEGKQIISCNTCHHGETPPRAPLSFAKIEEASPKGSGSQAPTVELPAADQLFARHLQAVGGTVAIEKIHSRVMKGTRFSSEGWSSPVEIDEEAPRKFRDEFKLKTPFVNVFDGSHGWNQDDEGVHEINAGNLTRLKLDAEFYRDLKLGEVFASARTTGKEKLDGKDCYVVEAKSAEGDERQLYFDAGTALLRRIVRFDPSPFGPIPNAIDYADYREVDGIQVPFTISHLRPDYSLMDKLTEVKHNVRISPDVFEKPTMPKKP